MSVRLRRSLPLLVSLAVSLAPWAPAHAARPTALPATATYPTTTDVPAADGLLVDPILTEGTPSAPTRDVAAEKRADAAARPSGAPVAPRRATASTGAPTASSTLPSYRLSASRLHPVAVGSRPYEQGAVTAVGGFGQVDAQGVRVVTIAGTTRAWDHPVGQAQYALANLNSYRLTRDPAYLRIAERNAQRLLDRKVVSGQGWYYPYDFDFAMGKDPSLTLRAPWYSAMAQGQATSVFVRLYEVTGNAMWREAADHTYASLLQGPDGTAPFVSYVDAQSRLWLEEYPRTTPELSEKVLNGHLFATFGVVDYWQMTRDAAVEQLARGALSTVEQTLMTGFRRPGALSVYCLLHQEGTLSYHPIHGEQAVLVHRMTHDPFWLRSAATLRDDYPKRLVSGTATLTPGTKVAVRLDAAGTIVARRRVVLPRTTSASFDSRWRGKDGRNYLRLTGPTLAGWWVAETPTTSWARGATERHEYLPAARLVFLTTAGRTGTTLRADGTVGTGRTTVIRAGSTAPTDASAWVGGRVAYHVTAGAFAGQWVPAGPTVGLG